jgi:hypothetical protein
MGVGSYTPTNSVQTLLSFVILNDTCYHLTFDNYFSDECKIICHCGFGLLFPDGGRITSSKNGIGKTGYPHAKQWSGTLVLHPA